MSTRNSYWSRKRHGGRTDLWSGGGQGFRAWMQAVPGKKGIPWDFAGMLGAGLLICAFTIPLIWSASWNSCTAFETALLRRSSYAVLGAKHQEAWRTPMGDGDRRSMSLGITGQQIAADEYRWLPKVVSCTLLFWQVRVST